jgi:rod shape-determining protein MreC
VPRNRTVRLAVLGSTVQSSVPPKSSTRSGPALRRRLVVGVLVALSLVLITLYFREPQEGALRSARDAGATGVRPFQVGAERVVRPFRDAYGYFAGLVAAKSEADRLRDEVRRLRQEATQYRTAFEENKTLREAVSYRAPAAYPADYRQETAAVIGHPPSAFEQRVTIAAGANDGIEVNDPVVTLDGLLGRVAKVASDTAQVTLLTDRSSNVSAVDLNTDAAGLVIGRGPDTALVLENVAKRYVVERGDEIVTEGSQRGRWPSLYPRGIPIGRVTYVGRNDTDLFMRIQVEPAADFGSLRTVIVLVPEDRQ